MVPPVARAANRYSASTLMESTSDTAEMAALPTVVTIMVSAVPMRALSSCSAISGSSSARICCLVNMNASPSGRKRRVVSPGPFVL